MKDTLILEHKVFISAKRAVLVSGYSSDYIGQLCREGKLVSKMIGKTWFLTEESLLNYKLSTKSESVQSDNIISKTNLEKNSTDTVIGDSIILDRMNFISSRKAAEVSGYTNDYIGQLCRLGKLESRRVGKAWFVSEKSILDHCVSLALTHSIEEKKNTEVFSPKVVSKEEVSTPVLINKVTFDTLKAKSNVLSLNYFSKTYIVLGISIVVVLFFFQYFATSKNRSVSISSSSSSRSEMPSNVIESPPLSNGLVVTPSSGLVSEDEAIKNRIQDSFSDEVKVSPDKSGMAGIITPVFKKAKGESFVYVMVPVEK